MNAIAVEGERSVKINERIIEMPAKIRHGLIFGNIFIVVLDTNYSMRNVFAFDENGNQIWQIEDPGVEIKGRGYAMVGDADGSLVALFRGAQFFIDPTTGKIYDITFDK